MQEAENECCVESNLSKKSKNEIKNKPIIKTPTDLQRLKLEKLMKNPEKPVIIPETRVEKDFMSSVPNFVRNVMGSSAGAGSGEFHVYRHLRRKEYARQKCIQIKSLREQLDEEYHKKLEQNRLEAEAKTNKRRAKRLRKKQKMKEKNGKRAKLQDGRQTEGANTDEETVKSDTDEKEQSDDSKGGIDDDKKPFGEFDRENNIET